MNLLDCPTVDRVGRLNDQLTKKIISGNYWGEEGALSLLDRVFPLRLETGEKRDGCFQMAQGYHSAFNNAAAHFQDEHEWLWIARMLVTYFWARFYLWHFLRLSKIEGYQLSCDEHDVAGSIWIALPFWKHKSKASDHFTDAIRECISEEKGDAKRALLIIKVSRCHKPARSRRFVLKALRLLPQNAEPMDAQRVYRDAALFFFKQGKWRKAQELAYEGIVIARNGNIPDGVIKLEGILKRYSRMIEVDE